MKKLFSFITFILVIQLIHAQQIDKSYRNIGYDYVSPLPNSKMVSPENNVIIRSHTKLSRQQIQNNFISISGSKSGNHEGKLILSDDNKTLIFKPLNNFELGESVTVKLNKGSLSENGNKLREFLYIFKTAPYLSKEKNFRIEESFQNLKPKKSTSLNKKSFKNSSEALPIGFPTINLISSGNSDEGKFFISPFNAPMSNNNYLIILDNNGFPIFFRKMDYRCHDFKVQNNGELTYYDEGAFKFYALNNSFSLIDSFKCGNGYQTDVHELDILPNGHALLLALDIQPYRMDTIVTGGNPNATVMGMIIQELDNDKNVVFEWRSWDHYKITDAMPDINLTAKNIDYVHGNALELDNDGNILFSARHMDEVTKIDRTTGDIIWRLGGKNNEFNFVNDEYKFSHQHDVRRLPNGDLTVFDNGNLHSPPFSRAVEYKIDDSLKTATLTWEYRNDPDFYSAAMGCNRLLPNGNRVIGWGFKGSGSADITEIDADNNIVFEASLPDTMYSYRAFKFPWKTDLFTLSSYNIGFGNVSVGQTASLTVMIKNNSQDSLLTISGYHHSNSSFLPIKEFPFIMYPGEEVPLTIKYTPDTSSLGNLSDRLYIFSEKPGERITQVVQLSGNTIVSVDDENKPVVFNLAQNYPNPFNPSTTIEYSIPKASNVTIAVFNILGEKVADLVNEEKSSGNYKVQFNGNGLASGIYIYKLTAGNFTQIKKLTLLK